jgi:glutamyl-tRNA(Gln) amidotransferase subunit E
MKIGLEIHQQLATKKLFCNDDSDIIEEKNDYLITRKLFAVKGDQNIADKAAVAEEKKGKLYIYEVTPNSCPVEWDEEPPHEINQDALEIAIIVSRMLHAHILDYFFVMRKIVVDGSNTSGFQRTMLIATNGYIELKDKRYGIETICLEEDAARKISADDEKVVYRLDRLGIPLIEIATSPDITSEIECHDVAEYIGMILRRTKRVRRGIGTIREDVNISIEGGNRVEIKGIQNLSMISDYVTKEVSRQKRILLAKSKLEEKNLTPEHLTFNVVDLTNVFDNTSSKTIQKAISNKGKVIGIKLVGFAGLLGNKYTGNERILGPEFASIAKALGAGGIFHSDELPNYGIEEKEVKSVKELLQCTDEDAFVLFAGNEKNGYDILNGVFNLAIDIFSGVPKQTRDPLPDGSTSYSRVISGQNRMYPETDILPLKADDALLKCNLPEMPDVVVERLVKEYGIDYSFSWYLMKKDFDMDFIKLMNVAKDLGFVTKIFQEVIPSLEKEGFEVTNIFEFFSPLANAYKNKIFAREAIYNVALKILKDHVGIGEAVKTLGLSMMDKEEVIKIVREILEDKKEYISKIGKEKAVNAIMGEAMKKVRGKYPGNELINLIKELLGENQNA